MKTFKKLLKILLIIFFPILILYCIGKNLFGGSLVNFLGGLFLIVLTFLATIYFFRYDLIASIFNFFGNFLI